VAIHDFAAMTGLHLKRRRNSFGKGEFGPAQQHGHRCGIGWRALSR
jgi:hypothetical protein